MTEISLPLATLSSGQTLKLRQVRLYNKERVREIAILRQQALKNLGGVTTGVGFWGSPEWAIGGALALGLIEGLLSGAAREKASAILQDVQQKTSELARSGKMIDCAAMSGMDAADPRAWSGTETVEEPVFEPVLTLRHSATIPRYAPEEIRQMLLQKQGGQQTGTVLKTITLIHNEDEFVTMGTDVGVLKVRWSSVVAYLPPQPQADA